MIAGLTEFCCYPCFLNQNVEWATRAKHVALTQDGLFVASTPIPNIKGRWGGILTNGACWFIGIS